MKNFISYLITIGLIIIISAAIVFNFYMGQLKPIKNLERFIPNHVTQIISQDDVVIKTFGVYKNTKVQVVVSTGKEKQQVETPAITAMNLNDFLNTMQTSKITYDVSTRMATEGEVVGTVFSKSELTFI